MRVLSVLNVVAIIFFIYINVVRDCSIPLFIKAYKEGSTDVKKEVLKKYASYEVHEIYRNEHTRIDDEDNGKRCEKYGLKLYNNGTSPRRIFFGAPIANENWEVYMIHAIEAFDIYHLAVFVESNTTYSNSPRKLRFKDSEEGDQLMYSKLFGPKTQIFMDFWLVDAPELWGMERESEQRNEVVKRWIREGMTVNDIGIMSDMDEVFSRDFLRAVQVCDFPELQPDQDCSRPKILPSSISFEGSPLCIKRKQWFHPDVITGQCVEGIGDPTERVVPLRNVQRRYGERHESYGKVSPERFPEAVFKLGRFPLFNGPDIRTVFGDRGKLYNEVDGSPYGENAIIGTAFHFHNWFQDTKTLRHKYGTYGHADARVMEKTLSQMGEDLDLLVRCARDLGNEIVIDDWTKQYYEGAYITRGTRPIFFLNKTYISERHEKVQMIVAQDESEFGSNYNASGKWVDSKVFPAQASLSSS
jgi:hypothetical protein